MHVHIDFTTLKPLSPGTSGYVYVIDDARVLKEYYNDDGGIVERQAFNRLGSHSNIIAYLGDANPKSIVLEYGQPLSTIAQLDQVPIEKRVVWIRDAAEGLAYIHKKGIIHADIGCENMVLIHDRLKIIDFEGCSIDGDEAASGYKWYNRRDLIVNINSDIFAYGCAVYQIITGKPPYYELAMSQDRSKVVRQLYSDSQFPDVSSLPLGGLIQGCWNGSFSSMDEVLEALDAASISKGHVVHTRFSILRWIETCFGS